MRRFVWGAAFLGLILQACASAPAPRSYLDTRTAATITVQEQPVVFARDEQMRAINVRDYAQLGAIEVNRMGERQLYLVATLWSTIDRTASERERLAAAFAQVIVHADDQPIALVRATGPTRPIGVGTRPYEAPSPGAQELYFPVTRAALQGIAHSRSLSLTTGGSGDSTWRFSEWRNGRVGLRLFIDSLPASASQTR